MIEPYPPLQPHERAQPRHTPRATPQLSASVAPEAYGAAGSRYGRQGSIFTRGRVASETPSARGDSVAPSEVGEAAEVEVEGRMAPPPARRGGRGQQQPLFRRESTGTESEAGTPAPAPAPGAGASVAERVRAGAEGLGGGDGGGPEGEEEGEEVDGYRALREMSQRLANADDEGEEEEDEFVDEELDEVLRRKEGVVPKVEASE